MASQLFSPLALDTFFETVKEPSAFADSLERIKQFVTRHFEAGRKIVIVSSGGTVVPLERQMVRFLDNFSAGTRGAISAEWFLRAGYAVLFLHRRFSFEPFARKFHLKDESILDYLVKEDDKIKVSPSVYEEMKAAYDEYTLYKSEKMSLLMVNFFTVSDYLFLLMETAKMVRGLGAPIMFYLAAAVSDFYLPETQVSEHKIQSEEGTLTMRLEPVPKLIFFITTIWAPNAFVATFKLETDPDLLLHKSRTALDKYQHQAVIANVLRDRKREVTILEKGGGVQVIRVDDPSNEEIEEQIVSHLINLHEAYIDSK